MITPAKWQTAEPNQKIASTRSYGDFRRELVPHMQQVVYYPNSLDVFDSVYQIDGISYYILDKDTHSVCVVHNINNDLYTRTNKINHIFQKHGEQPYKDRTKTVRNIQNGQSLLNIGQEIIDFISGQCGGEYVSFKPDEYRCKPNGKYKVWINSMTPGNQQVSSGGFLALGKSYIDENKPPVNECKIYFSSDSIDECRSYQSYLQTKFVRLFISSNFSKLNGFICNHCFCFVPAPMVLDEQGNRVPGKFDHIYTDEELYKTWNLPQKYIDVIEAVIKERK